MTTEIAYTVDRKYRVTYNNFWYRVEMHRPGGYRKVLAVRNVESAIFIMESNGDL